MEGLVYTCTRCQTQFMLRQTSKFFESFVWSEDEILKKLLDVPGQAGPSQLQRLWKRVFERLEDASAHREFVSHCKKMNQLECARQKYSQLHNYLNWSEIPADVKELLYPTPRKLSPWEERLPWVLMGVALCFVVSGLVLPQYQNMFGAGVLMGLLTFFFFRKRLRF